MKNEKFLQLIDKLTEQMSDRNSCLTTLARSRVSIMNNMGRMNPDNAANWERWREMKQQIAEIDQLILSLAGMQGNNNLTEEEQQRIIRSSSAGQKEAVRTMMSCIPEGWFVDSIKMPAFKKMDDMAVIEVVIMKDK